MAQRIVDLSHDMYHEMPVFPYDPRVGIITHHTIESFGYNMTQVLMSTHCGTHLDAPCHFIEGGRTVDRLDLERCVGLADVLDFSDVGAGGDITAQMLSRYDELLVPGARLLVRTDWDQMFPEPRFFTDLPGIAIDAAQLLADRGVTLLGLETPTVHATEFKRVHEILLGAEIVIVESLTGLCRLESARVQFIALPIKFRGRDGSPVRAIAIEMEDSR